MPRGKKLNPTGRIKRQKLNLSEVTSLEAEALASKLGLLNPRTGEGNKSEVVARAIAALSKSYPHYFPKQNELLLWVLGIANNQDISPELRSQAEEWADYIESWGVEQLLDESIGDGVIKTTGGSYIV